MTIRRNLLLATSIITLTVSASAFAQSAPVIPGSETPGVTDPNHPRVNEVDKRLENQDKRIDKGLANGTISPAQAQRDQARDAKIQGEAVADEAKNGDHLTKKEDRQLNRQLNRKSKDIKRQHAHGVKREKAAAAQ